MARAAGSRPAVAAILAVLLVCAALPGGAAAATSPWKLTVGGNSVTAKFLSDLTKPDVELSISNHTGIQFLGPTGTRLLELLGYKGTFSQEVTWTSGAGPSIGCPVALATYFCRTGPNGGTALVAGDIRAVLLAKGVTGSTTLTIGPSPLSLEWDLATVTLGLVLTYLAGGPVEVPASMLVAMVIEVLPEALGAKDAIMRGDQVAALAEFRALFARTEAIIADHLAQWIAALGVRLVLHLSGVDKVAFAIQASRALPVFVTLAAAIAQGSHSTVRVDYGAPGAASASSGDGSGTVNYDSDFKGWTLGPGWSELNGMLVSDGNRSRAIAPYEAPGPDYTVEAQVRIIRVNSAGSFTGRADEGVLVRVAPDQGGYQAGYCVNAIVVTPCDDQDSEEYGIYWSVGLIDGSPTKGDGGWHTYRVRAEGDVITFWVDGAMVATGTDNRALLGTQVGFVTSGIQVNVRSFTVSSP